MVTLKVLKKRKKNYGELSKIYYFLTLDDSSQFIYNLYNIPSEVVARFFTLLGYIQ